MHQIDDRSLQYVSSYLSLQVDVTCCKTPKLLQIQWNTNKLIIVTRPAPKTMILQYDGSYFLSPPLVSVSHTQLAAVLDKSNTTLESPSVVVFFPNSLFQFALWIMHIIGARVAANKKRKSM